MSIGRVPGATGIQPSIVTAKGDLIVATASGSVTNQAVGSNNQVLTADSAQADGVKWANGSAATLTTTGDILYASAANTPARLAIGSTGQVLKVSGGVPSWGTDNGKILQVVTATYSTNFTTTSTTYVDTGMSATITPTSATSTILVLHNGNYNQTSAASAVNIRLLRGATNIKTYNAQGYTNNNLFRGEITLIKMDSPATTSATTYKIQISNDTTATIGAQYNNEESTIILIEVGA